VSRPTDRRSALKRLVVLATPLVAACDAAIARLTGKRLVEVARTDNVRAGSAYRTTRGDEPLILTNDAGTIRTFAAICTHEGCPLGWNAQQRLIRCPCHGSAFDVHGQVVEGPAQKPLKEIETVVERGRVLIAIPRDTA
jgi:Rieske Fe-S protein